MNLTSNYYSPSGIIHMEKLVNTVQLLSLAQNIEEVMRIVRTVARELTGADGATFVLREDNLCYYADEDAIRPLWKGSKFPMHSCLSGWVMLNRKPAIVPDIFSDDRIPTSVYEPTFVRSVLMVPIRTIKPLGAIGNYWASKHEPTLEEITTLQSLADITAVSIEIIDVRNNLEFKVGERTRELMESLQREKELNKLKSNFVAMASHELKTPLSTILSSISLSERYLEIGEKEKRQKHIDRMKSSIQNMRETLDDFLIVEKLESEKSSLKWEEFELIPFLVEINSC
ncbi:MAG: GAF domain-containing protein, partial [Bacteroidia bacterium]|nr:GAF domain-containing protein [Bacteroidia bacterium]